MFKDIDLCDHYYALLAFSYCIELQFTIKSCYELEASFNTTHSKATPNDKLSSQAKYIIFHLIHSFYIRCRSSTTTYHII